MPTLKRFDEDAYRTACDATVVAVHPEGIELDATVFYARSGGQAGALLTVGLLKERSLLLGQRRQELLKLTGETFEWRREFPENGLALHLPLEQNLPVGVAETAALPGVIRGYANCPEIFKMGIQTLEQLFLLSFSERLLVRLERDLHERLLDGESHYHANDHVEEGEEDPFAEFLEMLPESHAYFAHNTTSVTWGCQDNLDYLGYPALRNESGNSR